MRNVQIGLITLFLSHLFCFHLSALDRDKPLDQYLMDEWNTATGLPSNTVRSIARTPDGYLWLAVTRGLLRFDGIKFSKIYFHKVQGNKSDKDITPDTLYVDKEGTLWIGSIAGLTEYRYKTRKFKTYTKKDGITGDRFRRIKADMNGGLWISFFASYLNRFAGGKFTAFNASHGLEGKKINSIIEDTKGTLFFGTRENGVFKFQQGKFVKHEIPGLGHDYLISVMYEDEKGALWIGTNKGLFRVTDGTTDIYTFKHGLSDNYIRDVIEDNDGNLWVGTVNGLNRIRRNHSGAISFDYMLKDVVITCLFYDNEDNLWVGTYDSGIKRLKDGNFRPYAAIKKSQREIIYSIFEDGGGDIHIGSIHGELYKCRAGKCIETLKIPGASGIGITAFEEDENGNLWLGTNGKGVFQGKGGTFVNFTSENGLADNLVISIFKDSRNNLWIGTFDGVSRYSNGVFKSFKVGDGLAGRIAYNVYEDRDFHIWIATDKGVNVLKNGEFTGNGLNVYLKDIPVTSIFEDEDGVYWMGTHGSGLKRFEKGKFVSYTTAEGMVSNFIYQLLEDEGGYLWMMSDRGVLRVKKDELKEFAAGRIHDINCSTFGISDGMQSVEFTNQFSRNSALETRDGEFMFITNKGITIVDPGKIKINKSPPPVVIEHVFFNDDALDIPLPGDKNSFYGIKWFAFYFTAPTFNSPEQIKFKYKLEGYNKDWVFIQQGEKRMARFYNLEPGTYTFRVTAGNNDGLWNKSGASLTFTLKACYYETKTFKIIVFIAFVLLAAGGYFLFKKRPFGKSKKYKSSSLSPIYVEECIKKLNYLMDMEKVYRDETISLQSLAEKLSLTPHQLSQILNEKLDKNFADFINTYRIEEIKRLLADPKTANRKIFSLAVDVGYNTRTAFNAAFKKYTKMTPSEYKKTLDEKDKM